MREKKQVDDKRKNHHRQPRVEVVCVGAAAAAALALLARVADALRLKKGSIRQDETQRIPVLGCKSDGGM